MERKRLSPELVQELENNKPQFRITHPDQHNWVLERFRKGGVEIKVGPKIGKLSKDKWVVLGYYANLKRALQGWLQEEIALALQDHPGEATVLLAALEEAEKRVLAQFAQVMPQEVAQEAPQK